MCDKVVFCTTKYLLSLITTGPPNYRQPTQIRHSYHNHHLPIQNSSQNHLHTLFTQLPVLSSLSIAWSTTVLQLQVLITISIRKEYSTTSSKYYHY